MATRMDMMPFTANDLVISNSSRLAPYSKTTQFNSISSPWRSTVMAIIEFLVFQWNPISHPTPNVVYVGSLTAPLLKVLVAMFPTVMWHLHLDQEIEVESDNVQLYLGIDDIAAQQYSSMSDVFFICQHHSFNADITNPLFNEVLTEQSTTDVNNPAVLDAFAKKMQGLVWPTMLEQRQWLEIIQPVRSYLQFILPYPDKRDPSKTVPYLSGQIYHRVWGGKANTANWLVVSAINVGDWNLVEYDQLCFFHNAFVRGKNTYINPLDDSDKEISPPSLTNDYDSTAEAYILVSYYRKQLVIDNLYARVEQLSGVITWAICGNFDEVTCDASLSSIRALTPKRTTPKKSARIGGVTLPSKAQMVPGSKSTTVKLPQVAPTATANTSARPAVPAKTPPTTTTARPTLPAKTPPTVSVKPPTARPTLPAKTPPTTTTARPAVPTTTARPTVPITTARPPLPTNSTPPAVSVNPTTTTRPTLPTTTVRPTLPTTTARPTLPTTTARPTLPTTTARPTLPTTTARPTLPTTTARPTLPTTTARPTLPTTTARPTLPTTTARPTLPTTTTSARPPLPTTSARPTIRK